MPGLAVARADLPVIQYRTQSGRMIFTRSVYESRSVGVTVEVEAPQHAWQKFTRVPMVPADVKQQLRGMGRSTKLQNYHVLWEVEKWYDRNPLEPPVDPYLLKHCGGSLFAALAEWDLTELERSVMRGLVNG